MNDFERIEQIMKDKQLNNQAFCNAVMISPASLSNILSQKTRPTLALMRSMIEAFPDINPLWIYSGEGNMYVADNDNAHQNIGDDTPEDNPYPPQTTAAKTQSPQTSFYQGDLFSTPSTPHTSQPTQRATNAQNNSNISRQGAKQQSQSAAQAVAALGSESSVADIIRTTIDIMQAPKRRQVTEVRIFFDDGTYETFCPKQ